MSVNKQTHKFQSFLVMSGDEIMFFSTQYCGVNLPARFPLATDTVSSGHDLHTHMNSCLQHCFGCYHLTCLFHFPSDQAKDLLLTFFTVVPTKCCKAVTCIPV